MLNDLKISNDLNILAYSSCKGHKIAYVENEKLLVTIDYKKKKNDFIDLLFEMSQLCNCNPNVIALTNDCLNKNENNWFKLNAVENSIIKEINIFGKDVLIFYSSEERANIYSAYSFIENKQKKSFYCVLYDEKFGSIYKINENCEIRKITDVIPNLKNKIDFLFYFFTGKMEQEFNTFTWFIDLYGEVTDIEQKQYCDIIIDLIYGHGELERKEKKYQILKDYFNKNYSDIIPNKEIGLNSENKKLFLAIKEFVINEFIRYATHELDHNIPIIIAGEGSKIKDWNEKWRNCKCFSNVHISSSINDSGIAIGLAAEANILIKGMCNFKVNRNYKNSFKVDCELDGFRKDTFTTDVIIKGLRDGKIYALIQDDDNEMNIRCIVSSEKKFKVLLAMSSINKSTKIEAKDIFRNNNKLNYLNEKLVKIPIEFSNYGGIQKLSEIQSLKYFDLLDGIIVNDILYSKPYRGFLEVDIAKRIFEEGLNKENVQVKKLTSGVNIEIVGHESDWNDNICLIDCNDLNIDWEKVKNIELLINFTQENLPWRNDSKSNMIGIQADDTKNNKWCIGITQFVEVNPGVNSIKVKLDKTNKITNEIISNNEIECLRLVLYTEKSSKGAFDVIQMKINYE